MPDHRSVSLERPQAPEHQPGGFVRVGGAVAEGAPHGGPSAPGATRAPTVSPEQRQVVGRSAVLMQRPASCLHGGFSRR